MRVPGQASPESAHAGGIFRPLGEHQSAHMADRGFRSGSGRANNRRVHQIAHWARYLAALLCASRPALSAPPRRPAAVPPGLPEPLTKRETDVLRLIAAGKSNQRIARELVVTLDTVKKHVSHLLGKLGAANRTEAVTRARQLGLIP